jgi:hypothetical protein
MGVDGVGKLWQVQQLQGVDTGQHSDAHREPLSGAGASPISARTQASAAAAVAARL